MNGFNKLIKGTMKSARPFGNLAEGAIQDVGMAFSRRTGLTNLASSILAMPVEAAKAFLTKKNAPKPQSAMKRALSFISKPTVLAAGAAIGAGGAYMLTRIPKDPKESGLTPPEPHAAPVAEPDQAV